MKKPITIIFNDIHIKNGNEGDIYRATKFLVDKAIELNIKEIICNGDVFDSRSFQRLSHLKCWEKCLDLFNQYGIICHTNVGNHDKSVYKDKESFLDSFKYHPAMRLYSEIQDVKISGKIFTFSPYFEDDFLLESLKKRGGTDVLIGHWSCDGSTYLGRSKSKDGINKQLLSRWKKTYLGHYHNFHEVSENIVHLPAFVQHNFGEDNNKGFSIIYDDLSYEIVKGKFREFEKIVIDINTTTIEEIKKIISKSNKENSLRLELVGDENKLKSFDKSIFNEYGVDIKLKYEKNFNVKSILPKVNKKYDAEMLTDEFKVFCKSKGLDYNFGKKLFLQYLKQRDEKK